MWATSDLHHRKEFGNRGLLYVVDISYGWLFLNDVRQPIGWRKEVSLILLAVLFVIKLLRPCSTSLYVVLSQQIWLNVLQQAGLERISPFNAAGSFSSFVESVSQVDKQQRQGFKFTNYPCCLGALETSQQRCFSDAVSEENNVVRVIKEETLWCMARAKELRILLLGIGYTYFP